MTLVVTHEAKDVRTNKVVSKPILKEPTRWDKDGKKLNNIKED